MKQIVYDEYHKFLKKRTFKSKLYRKFLLFPRLCKYMSGKALDVGPGIGEFIKFRGNTIGVDINPDNVKFCNENKIDVRLMEIDILPFCDEEFQSVNMDNVLEHIEDPDSLLWEINRVLEPGGVFVVGVPGILGFKTGPDHEIFYSKVALKNKITSFGFEMKEMFCMPFESTWLDKHMRQYCYYGVFTKVRNN